MPALGHFRIVELAEGVAGEYCGKLLADFGAQVVKVERPGTGSPTRALGPFKDDVPGVERSGLFAYLNTNKNSVTIDLETPEGVAALAILLARADAVIDDHAPGWLASVGLDPDGLAARYPALTLCAITPFGQSAPDTRRHATDLTVMQASGWGFHTPSGGDPAQTPLKGAGRFMVSYEAGTEGAMCVAASLYAQQAGARGRFIDISAQEVMASRVDYVLGQMVTGDMDVGEERTRFDLGGPAGILPCRDGFVYIFMSTVAHWQAIRTLIGEPEWAKAYPENWLERGLTPERIAEVRAAITAWLSGEDKDVAADTAQKLGLTLVPVNNASDLPRSPQFQHRGFFAEVTHPVIGAALYPTVPYKLSVTPARIERAAPLLGQHDGEIGQ